MIIKNRKVLATTRMRDQALDIIEAGITAVLPPSIMSSAVRYREADRTLTVNANTFAVSDGRIFVIGGGKASGLMAQALESIIKPGNITDGLVNCKGGHYGVDRIKIMTAGHPIPDERGIDGVRKMMELRKQYSVCETDLVLCLISGGGSALMPCPVDEVSLGDKQEVTRLLVGCGAEIDEINAVRKHLSKVKGGQLGRFFSPANVVSLILSDVIGNDMSVIASGPTFPDSSTFSDAYAVLERYNLIDSVPKSVTRFLRKGCLGQVADTPKVLDNCHNYVIGDNKLALDAMQRKADELGLASYIVTSQQKGDAEAVARSRADEILDMKYDGYSAILIGGETTVTLPPSAGRGGRNQHHAAVSMLAMEGYSGDWVVASVGTDGSDFLPDVAGAIVDQDSLSRARAKGIDVESYIEKFDSHGLLRQIDGSLVLTGDTGTNVGDVIVYLMNTVQDTQERR